MKIELRSVHPTGAIVVEDLRRCVERHPRTLRAVASSLNSGT
jgi:hypothetical protein